MNGVQKSVANLKRFKRKQIMNNIFINYYSIHTPISSSLAASSPKRDDFINCSLWGSLPTSWASAAVGLVMVRGASNMEKSFPAPA